MCCRSVAYCHGRHAKEENVDMSVVVELNDWPLWISGVLFIAAFTVINERRFTKHRTDDVIVS